MRFVGRLAPALLLMAAIFFVSAQSSLPRVESGLDVALRKAAHMTEFGLLWVAWTWALRGPRPRAALTALAITLAYAVSDEVHQSFVAERHPSAWDVAIDAAGMGVAAAGWVLWQRRRARPPAGLNEGTGGQGEAVSLIDRADAFQRRHPALGFPIAVIYKYTDDSGGYLAALVTYYGLLSLFPLLLLLSTILGIVLDGNPALQQTVIDSALGQFPGLGGDLQRPGQIGGGTTGLVVGVLGSLYGGLGVAQAAQNAMNTAWAVPRNSRPNPFKARALSLLLLLTIGLGVLTTTALTAIANGAGGVADDLGILFPVGVFAATIAVNTLLFATGFRIATARALSLRDVLPGALTAAVLWQVLQTVGAAYVGRVSESSSATSGVFGVVLGLIAFLFLASTIVVLCVEINVVLKNRLYPRALLTPFTDAVDLTQGDRDAYTTQAEAQRAKGFQQVDVRFGPRPGEDASEA